MKGNGGTISPLEAVLGVAATFFISMFLGSAFLLLLDDSIVAIIVELLILVIPLGYMLHKKVDVKGFIGLHLTPRNTLLGIALAVLLFLFNVFVTGVLTSVFGTSELVEESNRRILEDVASPVGLLSWTVALFLAGVCEEFTFRGFLQTSIIQRYPLGAALFISSLAFGLFHFDPQFVYTVSALLMGLMLGYVYHRWQSYVVPALAHSFMNLIVLAAYILLRAPA